MSKWRPRLQRGDTIIEVMLVVAILGLAFALAYATANAAVIKTRNAQEHAEALQYLNSQLELLRNVDQTAIIPFRSAPFCMETVTDTPQAVPNAVCNVGTEDTVGAGGRYKIKITYDTRAVAADDDRYLLQVDWEGPGGLGLQHEKIYYKLHGI